MRFIQNWFLKKFLPERRINVNIFKPYSPQFLPKSNHCRVIGLMPERFNHAKSTACHDNPDGIYVQVLPVVLASSQEQHPYDDSNNSYIKSSEKPTSESKILLCKWNSGDFKARYTGLIKPLARQEYDTILHLHETKKIKEKHDLLLQSAKSLMPSPLKKFLGEIRLVGLLRFQDPPVYDEYVYLATLIVPNSDSINDTDKGIEVFRQEIAFQDNSCHWFRWDRIPFQEMPADDELWYPAVLQQQQKVKGSFTFGGWTEKTIKSFQLQTVQQIE